MHRKLQKTAQSDVLISPNIAQYPCVIGTNLIMDGVHFPYRRVLGKKDGRTKFDGNNPMQKQVVKWEEMLSAADGSDKDTVLPLVLYLSSARLWNEDKNSRRKEGIPGRTDAYYRCLDKKKC